MLGIRTAPKEDLNCSAAEMVFGSTLIVPGEFVSLPKRQHDSLITNLCLKLQIFKVILSAHRSKPWILLILSLCKLTGTKLPCADLMRAPLGQWVKVKRHLPL